MTGGHFTEAEEDALEEAGKLEKELRRELTGGALKILNDLFRAVHAGETIEVSRLLYELHPIVQAATGDVRGLGLSVTRSYHTAISQPCDCPHTGHLLESRGCGGPRKTVQRGPDKGVTKCYACWAATDFPAAGLLLDDTGTMRVIDAAAFDRLYLEGSVTDDQAWAAFAARTSHDYEENEAP